MRTKRRALVLVDESARHPFRRSLPPHWRKVERGIFRNRDWPKIELQDLKGFFATYCAAFVVVSIFIA